MDTGAALCTDTPRVHRHNACTGTCTRPPPQRMHRLTLSRYRRTSSGRNWAANWIPCGSIKLGGTIGNRRPKSITYSLPSRPRCPCNERHMGERNVEQAGADHAGCVGPGGVVWRCATGSVFHIPSLVDLRCRFFFSTTSPTPPPSPASTSPTHHTNPAMPSMSRPCPAHVPHLYVARSADAHRTSVRAARRVLR